MVIYSLLHGIKSECELGIREPLVASVKDGRDHASESPIKRKFLIFEALGPLVKENLETPQKTLNNQDYWISKTKATQLASYEYNILDAKREIGGFMLFES